MRGRARGTDSWRTPPPSPARAGGDSDDAAAGVEPADKEPLCRWPARVPLRPLTDQYVDVGARSTVERVGRMDVLMSPLWAGGTC